MTPGDSSHATVKTPLTGSFSPVDMDGLTATADWRSATHRPWDTWVEKARGVPIEAVIASRGIKVKRQGIELVGPCPRCGGHDRFSISPRKQVWHCRRCKPANITGDAIGLVQWLDGIDFKAAIETLTGEEMRTVGPTPRRVGHRPEQNSRKEFCAADDHEQEQRVGYAIDIWRTSTAISGTLGERYLFDQRGLAVEELGDLSHVLRWNDAHRCLVALMSDPRTAEPIGIHRIFVNPNATKAKRWMLGRRGVIRLSPDHEVTMGIGLVEGVEDGLAVLLGGWQPVWVATCADEIRNFPVLSGIEALTVFADADSVGINAASECVQRWRCAGRDAVLSPPRTITC
jgi:CHC2 zinc finger/Toprim domain